MAAAMNTDGGRASNIRRIAASGSHWRQRSPKVSSRHRSPSPLRVEPSTTACEGCARRPQRGGVPCSDVAVAPILGTAVLVATAANPYAVLYIPMTAPVGRRPRVLALLARAVETTVEAWATAVGVEAAVAVDLVASVPVEEEVATGVTGWTCSLFPVSMAGRTLRGTRYPGRPLPFCSSVCGNSPSPGAGHHIYMGAL